MQIFRIILVCVNIIVLIFSCLVWAENHTRYMNYMRSLRDDDRKDRNGNRNDGNDNSDR